jgi:hypothetical protein
MIPSARRLMESLRDIGYDLSSAVADLVDNSIDADADTIRIDSGVDELGGWIRIADDGIGMTERRLDEAMRYGSSRDYAADDLGHFGLGLKTASLSQGRRLTVATRSTAKSPIRIRRWDLDHVAITDSWDLEQIRAREAPNRLTAPLAHSTGTVVLWERLDRVLGDRRLGAEASERRLVSSLNDVAQHLAMVFHRFLDGTADGPQLDIYVNESPVTAWDPFARSEPLTKTLKPQTLQFEFDGEQYRLLVQPYVLPSQHHFSSPEAHELAGGPNRWNRQQGLYVYRHDRLIQSGGWNRLRTLDEHAKLARVAVDIPVGADAAFRINVSKMSIGLPDTLRPELRALVAGVVIVAQDAYRRRLAVISNDDTGERVEEAMQSPQVTIGDQWPIVFDVLSSALADQPDLLDRILVDLANLRPPSFEHRNSAVASSG